MDASSKAAIADPSRPASPAFERVLPVRRLSLRFDADERLWFRGDAFRTAIFNAYVMLLGDEFEFVAIMHQYLALVRNDKLAVQLRSWLGQERAHGVQHRRAYAYLDRVGLHYRGYHAIENHIYFRLLMSLFGVKQRVALIAGLEHFNTMLGEIFLRDPHHFDGADADLSMLLKWHYAEEIEHRAVVHDVATDVGVGYFTRVIMGMLAFILYSGTLFFTAFWFAAQKLDVLRPSAYASLFRFLFVDEKFLSFCLSYSVDYLSPQFHPLNRDSDRFAVSILNFETAVAP
jgi:uncharacterized protein